MLDLSIANLFLHRRIPGLTDIDMCTAVSSWYCAL